MADDPEPDVDDLEPDAGEEPADELEDQEGSEADEADTGDVDAQEPDVAAATQKPSADDRTRTERQPASRAEKRITAQQEELRRRDQQIADLNKRLDTVLAQSTQPRPPQETAEQREQRLALLDPVERMRVELQESQATSQRQMAQMAFTFQDSGDKASFEAKALIDPLYAKWAPKVEAFLTELRGKGQNVLREQALKFLIGEAIVAQRKTSSGQQRKAAETRIARNKTRPSNSRSDAQADRRSSSDADALEKRLENVQI